jgi:CheY-like chemotaxis protein
MSDFTIMLVDDDSDVLGAIGVRCRARGWNVLRAHNLLTATSLIEMQRPDALCIDVRMPTGNGLSFCETLAAGDATRDIPVIVVTGQRDEETIRRCQQLGAQYIAKRPDVWSELEPALEKLNQRRNVNKLTKCATPGLASQAAKPTSRDANEVQGKQTLRRKNAATAPPTGMRREPFAPLDTRTIVIADDDADLVDSLSHRCSQLGCRVIGTGSALEAINIIEGVTPDLVCLDVNMPAGSGLGVCEMMSASERLRSIPIIVLTGNSDEQTIRRCHNLLVYYVEKSVDVWDRLQPLIMELLGPKDEAKASRSESCSVVAPTAKSAAAPSCTSESLIDAVFEVLGGGATPQPDHVNDDGETPPWVLSIDDDSDFSDALKCRLESYGVAVIRAFSGMEGYRMAFTHPASAILLDYNMPNGQGDYILGRLKENPATRDIPVIILTGVRDKWLERKMYGLGASGFLNKPVQFDALRSALARHLDILAEPVAV